MSVSRHIVAAGPPSTMRLTGGRDWAVRRDLPRSCPSIPARDWSAGAVPETEDLVSLLLPFTSTAHLIVGLFRRETEDSSQSQVELSERLQLFLCLLT
jgi:hypothetical protein